MITKTKSVGGVVINKKTGKVLVVSQNGNSWSLPKGKFEPGEKDGVEVAKREIKEESGVTELTFVKELPVYERFMLGFNPKEEDKSHLKEIHMFLFETNQDELKPEDPDNPEARWIEKLEVSKLLTHPKDKEFFEKVLKEI
ncbi:MAG: NUDIX domain-containing protein [Candidatus Gracilibacteria bacterium]